MFALLSPAKKLDANPVDLDLEPTVPPLLDQATALMDTVRPLGPGDLSALMSISDNLATLNHARFQAWSPTHDDTNSLPAALTFAGDTYVGFDARSLSENDLTWAQEHVGILSGLYGLLRPLDRIQPYRLEMGTRLDNPRGRNLYAWWDDRIADQVSTRAESHTDPTVVNLASNEYFKAVGKRRLRVPVITPAFKDVKNGKARVISFYAKRARGAMARWMVTHRVEHAEALKAAEPLGYRFDPESSTETRWVYTRPQPPKKS